ncbi:MAG: hypothetical protein EAZ15_00230 [Sphingobacteriales bacterium]|nr:MAG: hypothetical protein EAZ15_00230 [Sphingobacteriales bacterium]
MLEAILFGSSPNTMELNYIWKLNPLNRCAFGDGLAIIWIGKPIIFFCRNIHNLLAKQFAACCSKMVKPQTMLPRLELRCEKFIELTRQIIASLDFLFIFHQGKRKKINAYHFTEIIYPNNMPKCLLF